MSDEILYEDNHLLVVHKPQGMLTQGDKTEDAVITDGYKGYLKDKYNKPGNVFLQPAHRLDRPVSGCIILTRTSKATSRVTTAFRENKVAKTYLMISDRETKIAQDTIVHYLIKDEKHNRVRAHDISKATAKRAELSYRLLAKRKGKYLYEIRPVTGRSHQIRVQMSQVGAPIIGDVKYGGSKHDDPRSILLHCHKMTFDHPTLRESISVKCIPTMHGDWMLFEDVCRRLMTS